MARPRLDRNAYEIVLEALAELYRLTVHKKRLQNKEWKLDQIYCLFWALADKRIGRRSSWGWSWSSKGKPMKAYYKMMDKIKEIKSQPETKQDQVI
jgi:hypothetical protein